MRIAIVGGAGFIGQRLGSRCAEAGGEAFGYDIGAPAAAAPFPVEPHDVLRDSIRLPADVDVVYYLAQARAEDRRSGSIWQQFAINTLGAVRTAEAARAAGARCFCFASTGTVYEPGFEPMGETRPVRRDQPYALSKVAGEEALALLDGPMRLLTVRLFGVFGPGQAGMLVPNVADRVRERRPVTLQSNPSVEGDQDGLRISLTFVDDVVDCLTALTDAVVAGSDVPGIVNVASEEVVSIRMLADVIGREIGVTPVFERAADGRESDYVADVRRLRSLVAVRFTPLVEAVRRTLEQHV